jgi:hypothetical protein
MLLRCSLPILFVGFVASGAPPGSRPEAAVRWDALGHRTIAAIAYERLGPATRQRVDALLRQHPDHAALAGGLVIGAPDTSVEIFMRAATWPDMLRGDPRFYNEASATAAATPMLPGFPDMGRHAGWHYINEPFSTDGTPTVETAVPNALTQIVALTSMMGDSAVPAPARAYHLSWILHMVGDIHQPLHAVARFSRRLPMGDAGGNRVQLQSGASAGDTTNLHSFWDGLLGRPNRGGSPVEIARRLAAETRPVDNSEIRVRFDDTFHATVRSWVTESATLARYVVYSLPEREDGAPPPRATGDHQALAEDIARQRIAIAGYRLANLIEARLGG